jgi:RNA polymerase sigma-70 factor (ECF subfamily)
MEQEHSETHERFLTLFTVNEPGIRAFVRRLVPTRQDAADVMQGVALVLWRKFRELRSQRCRAPTHNVASPCHDNRW